MNYATIKDTDIANGEGVRVSLFVSGCTHHCKNCFNKETWDFNYGNEFSAQAQDQILQMIKPSYITGLTLLGGEPMEPQNQRGLFPFIKKFKEVFGDTKTIWCYTGFVFDKDLKPGGKAYTEVTDQLLNYFNVMVDGPFVDGLKDISLKFRGSSNQRIIDVKKSLEQNKVVLYMQ
ncbi:MAG: anaerobic ribonucleoside-triphosphate reductase activating protein [Clostridia bacterium]|nr:anaerobic ribonucleoside-triphosphate reductase activating protein [Clostridia bacterium]